MLDQAGERLSHGIVRGLAVPAGPPVQGTPQPFPVRPVDRFDIVPEGGQATCPLADHGLRSLLRVVSPAVDDHATGKDARAASAVNNAPDSVAGFSARSRTANQSQPRSQFSTRRFGTREK